MKLEIMDIGDVDKETLGNLKRLTLYFKDGGYRGMAYDNFCRPSGNEQLIIAREGTKIVSWAMIIPQSFNSNGKKDIYFYTHSKYRRKGYGTILARYIKTNVSGAQACPWDTRSSNFFKATKMPINPYWKSSFTPS